MGAASLAAIRIVAGRLCHRFGRATSALSVLERLFGMAQEQGPWRHFDAFEHGELLTARGLVFIVGQDLQRSLYPWAFETDA
eukprot:3175446-Lingulodinium_polyedra.AAC.1